MKAQSEILQELAISVPSALFLVDPQPGTKTREKRREKEVPRESPGVDLARLHPSARLFSLCRLFFLFVSVAGSASSSFPPITHFIPSLPHRPTYIHTCIHTFRICRTRRSLTPLLSPGLSASWMGDTVRADLLTPLRLLFLLADCYRFRPGISSS